MTKTISIGSIGPPPEIHADRVTGEMLHVLALKYTTALATIWQIVQSASSDGGPRAQKRICERIARSGLVYSVTLRPGKRGRYDILMTALCGWDPQREALIGADDPIPERPWLAGRLVVLHSQGNGRDCR